MTSDQQITIPIVPHSRITADVLRRVSGMIHSITAPQSGAVEAERHVESEYNISAGTQRRYKSELRKLFHLASRSSIVLLLGQQQLRQAIEFVIVRDERSDKNSLRSAKNLSIIVPNTGEMLSVENFLKSLYPREGVNASSCYKALRSRCIRKQVFIEAGDDSHSSPCTLADLPSQGSVIRFLRKWRQEYVAVRRGRSRTNDWEKQQQAFVTRDVTKYHPGELWIGDHTELDFMVLNEHDKLDRRWITAFIDIRTGLVTGYNLNWQPCSQTIALAFRAGVLGAQLRAFTGDKYEPIQLTNIPETVMLDNGKDYRSKYTQRMFGKIDFEDQARLSIQRMTRLHYTLPYHGQSKAQMERWFRTIQTMLKYLPGFKSNKYENKPDTLKEDIKQGKILRVEEFDALVAKGINVYNNRLHRTLKNQTPLQCYLTNMSHQRTIDLRVLDFLMMRVSSKPIRRCQIKLFGSEYYSDALQTFNDKRADVYYDPHDLGFVSLYVNGEFAAVACNKEMIGRDENGWKKILASRKRGEHEMQEDLKDFRKGITNDVARMLLQEGELMDATPVSDELLGKRISTFTLMTGLEQDARKVDEEMKQQEELVEIERKSKKRSKHSPAITLANIGNVS